MFANGRRLRRGLLLGCVLLLALSVGCGREAVPDTGSYGYKEKILPAGVDRYPTKTILQMLENPAIDTILVVVTEQPLEDRPLREWNASMRKETNEKHGTHLQPEYFSTPECTVLDVVRNTTGRPLAPGDTVVIGEQAHLLTEETEGGSETVLVRPDPHDFPIETGHPTLVLCTSMQAFDEEQFFYFPQPYSALDLISREPTDREMAALTPEPGEVRATDFAETLLRFTQRKAAASAHSDLAPYFDRYEGKIFPPPGE